MLYTPDTNTLPLEAASQMLKLFISYSHKDREWCDRLNAH